MSALVRNNTFACTKLVQQHIGFSSSQWRLFLLYVWYCCCINAATKNLFFRLKMREDDRMREKTLHTKKMLMNFGTNGKDCTQRCHIWNLKQLIQLKFIMKYRSKTVLNEGQFSCRLRDTRWIFDMNRKKKRATKQPTY